jgi:hypothetical protein
LDSASNGSFRGVCALQAEVSMNRRLPRFMLHVVLLLSMLVAFQGGSSAQDIQIIERQGPSCSNYKDLTPPEDWETLQTGTNEESGYRIDSVFRAPADTNSPPTLELIHVTLLPEGELTVVPTDNAIIRVDSDIVTFWNCNEQNPINLYVAGGSEPVAIQPNQGVVVQPDQAVIVTKGDSFYFSYGNANATPENGALQIQQLGNPLTANQPVSGAGLSVSFAKPAKLCSGGGCS